MNTSPTVRDFPPNLRVIKCKARRGEAVSQQTPQFQGLRSLQPPPSVRSPTVRKGANKKESTKMKKQAYTVIALLVLVGSMAVAAQAQTSGRTQLIAKIPFQFNAGNKTLPAGEYSVRQVNPDSDCGVLLLSSRDGNASAMIQVGSVIGKAQETAKLTFHRYGNKYFFAQAWIDGDNTGMQAPKSKAERAAESELAGLQSKTETVALRAR